MARRVTVTANIAGTDHETFGSNEYGDASFTRETIISNLQPQDVLQMECRWGGECRAELKLVGQVMDSQDVRISGNFRLYEGIDEDSQDLDGEAEFTFLVPKGKMVSNEQRVDNKDEGGDFATVKMTVSNSIVED